MQYDENAEKYGYDGEMTPMKCDELKVYVPQETSFNAGVAVQKSAENRLVL